MADIDHSHHRDYLALTMAHGLGLTTALRLLQSLGSPAAILQADRDQLVQSAELSPRVATRVVRALEEIQSQGEIDHELEMIQANGVQLISIDEPTYPPLLRLIPNPPLLLWVHGEIHHEDGLAIALVGSRKATLYGKEQASRMAGQLSQAGLTIVSGGAYGIDKAAHLAALDVKGRTLAVLGSGLDKPYPAAHRPMFDRIVAEQQGAVISEFPMTRPAKAENFPRRNRVISGLSLGVLVIEAALRSGASITARTCVEEQGRELMALPGRVDSITSAGCHRMIREGWASLVTSPAEVLGCLGETGRTLDQSAKELGIDVASLGLSIPTLPNKKGDETKPQLGLFSPNDAVAAGVSELGRSVLNALTEARNIDELLAVTSVDPGTLRAELTMLQLQGHITLEGGLYRKAR